ncbi:hypothetical protein Tco_0189765 [Tanacetum coccineum]
MSRAETPDRRSCKVKATHSSCKRKKERKGKASDTQLGKHKKEDKDIVPAEATILIISRESPILKRKSLEEPVDEVPLDVTIGESPYTRTETLNFVIVSSDSHHNFLLGRIAMQKMGGKHFNTEHKLNEFKHIKPVKQKKRGLGPNHNEAACKEVDELMKAGIL